MSTSKKYLITGATGFIGSALSKKLLKNGDLVYIVDTKTANFDEFKKYPNARVVKLGFEHYLNLDQIVKDTNFDAIVHFAFKTSNFESIHNDFDNQIENIKAHKDLAIVSKKIGSKLNISIGSVHQYATSRFGSEMAKKSPYGIIKNTCQDIFSTVSKNNDIDVLEFIFPNVFGNSKNTTNDAIGKFTQKMTKGQDIDLIDYDANVDFIWIDTLVEKIVFVLSKNYKNERIYFGEQQPLKFGDLLETIKYNLSSQSKLNFGEYKETLPIDFEKIYSTCKFVDIPVKGINNSIDKYIANMRQSTLC